MQFCRRRAARDRAETLLNRGVLYNMVGRYESAWADFNASLVINPDQGDRYLDRGAALMRMGRFDEALADIERGMKLGVSMAEAGYFDLATVEEQWGRLSDAYHDYQSALAQDPSFDAGECGTEALRRCS